MDELIKHVNETLIIIDRYCDLLILEDEQSEQYIDRLSITFSRLMPSIIGIYSGDDDNSIDMREYWLSQLRRIIDVLKSQDSFLKIDVLKYETCENLKELLSMVETNE